MARLGANVIVVGRNLEKSVATVNMIKQQTGNPNVEFVLADLSSQKEIHQLAQQFKSRYQRLHVLINNAGAVFTSRQESVDGIEMTLGGKKRGQATFSLSLHSLLSQKKRQRRRCPAFF